MSGLRSLKASAKPFVAAIAFVSAVLFAGANTALAAILGQLPFSVHYKEFLKESSAYTQRK